MTPRIKAALFYNDNGFGIVGCYSPNADGSCRCGDPHDKINGKKLEPKSRGKHPLEGNGPAHPLTRDGITVTLGGPTEPNYGIVPPPGCVEWDIDGEDIKVYADLVAKYGPLTTMTTKTGNGSHVVFRWPSWAGPIPKGNHFDFVTRSVNGYVIGPESMHYNGTKYEAVRDARGMPLLPVDLPPSWVNAVIAQTKGKEKVEPGDDEKRHPAIVKAAVAARKRGDDEAGVMAAAMECNATFDNPKDEAEIRAITVWVMENVEADPLAGENEATKKYTHRLQLRRDAVAKSTLFVDPVGNSYAQIEINGHTETVEIDSRRMNDWLTMLYVRISHGNVPTPDTLSQATDYLATKARLSGKVREVGVRIAPLEGEAGFALDLGSPDWTAAVVRPGRWAIEPHPVPFTRSDSVAAIPSPSVGRGVMGIESLRPLLNLPAGSDGDTDWIKIVGFLLGAVKPGGPFAGLMLTGQAGSAKSSAARFIRRVIDPTPRLGEVMSAPAKEDGFAAAVRGGHVLAIDNVSAMPDALSDWLAQLATGYSSTKRALYTNNDAYVTKAVRPFIINGIDNAERGDLLSRLLSITLQPIDAYSTFDSLYRAFDAVWADVLGGLLDVAAVALAVEPTLPETGWTARMADHVRWVTAAERTLGWPDRSYERLMAESQAEAQAETLEALLWWPHLLTLLVAEGGSWEGTRTDLLNALLRMAEDRFGNVPNKTSWPRTGKGLGDAMSRAAGGLRTQGVTVTKKKVRGERIIVVERRVSPPPTGGPSAPSGGESAPNHAQGADGGGPFPSSTPAASEDKKGKEGEKERATVNGNGPPPSAPSMCPCGAAKTPFGGCDDIPRHRDWAKGEEAVGFDPGYDGFVKGTH